MKKFLLSLAVAFVAVAASAQEVSVQPTGKALSRPVAKMQKLNVSTEALASVKDFSLVKNNLRKVEKQSDLYGDYIEDQYGECHECGVAALEGYEYTDEETGQKEELVLLTLDGGVCEVLGYYYADGDSVVVPAQYAYKTQEGDDYYESIGDAYFVFYAYNEGDKYFSDAVFDIEDDGSLSLRQDLYLLLIDSEGEYGGYSVDGWHRGVYLYKTNALQNYNKTSNNQWGTVEADAYVEDYGDMASVYNFCNLGYADFTINDDLTVSIETLQPMYYLGFTDETTIATYGNFMNLCGVTIEDRYLYPDPKGESVAELSGTLSGNTIKIGGSTSEDYTYFVICSNADANGAFYSAGYYCGYSITLNEGVFANGIEEVTGTREDKIRNTKTYNLMGQRVNRDTAKGLLIRGGKKYIKK